uniref:ATP synthase subunit a n=1 Tax=Ascidiella aspersa TaxID=201961 RepID=S0DFF5_9ASCI|nr:ATP synthase F0 subunit 6 [Ascidiella aspersa]CCO25806.1 ATPase subunit 6 [Ascidiella aspersa]
MFGGFESFVFWGVPLSFLFVMLFLFLLFNKPTVAVTGMLVFKQFSGLFFSCGLLIVGLFYFILGLNLVGLVPGGFSVSALISITLGVAFMFWLSNYMVTFFLSPKFNVAHFLPVGTPGFLVVFLVWIELVSWLARPLALGVRLMANITAGHLLLGLLSSGVVFMGTYSVVFGFVGVCLFMSMVFLELAVAFIQAYVFSLLLSLYTLESLGH